ncbi:UNVERIFIED_CONTAM: hypothetical protein FKN15_061919 [Acipenser sinensis]
MAQETLVFEPLPAAAGPALGDHGSPQSGKRHSLAPRTGQTPAVGLVPERDRLSALGLSDAVSLKRRRALTEEEIEGMDAMQEDLLDEELLQEDEEEESDLEEPQPSTSTAG